MLYAVPILQSHHGKTNVVALVFGKPGEFIIVRVTLNYEPLSGAVRYLSFRNEEEKRAYKSVGPNDLVHSPPNYHVVDFDSYEKLFSYLTYAPFQNIAIVVAFNQVTVVPSLPLSKPFRPKGCVDKVRDNVISMSNVLTKYATQLFKHSTFRYAN